MKHRLFLLFLTCFGLFFSSKAQNPAFEFEVYGSSEINTNFLDYGTIEHILRGGEFTEQDKQDWERYIDKSNDIRMKGGAGARLMFAIGKEKNQKLGLRYTMNFSGGIKLSDNLWKTALYGNGMMGDSLLDMGTLGYNAAGYSTLLLLYQTPKIKLNEKGDFFCLDLELGPRVGHNMINIVLDDVYARTTEYASQICLDGNSSIQSVRENKINGYGAGWDLGLHFGGGRTFGDWNVDFFTKGFGFILWNKNTYNLQEETHLVFEGFEINDFDGISGTIEQQWDSLKNDYLQNGERAEFLQWQSSSINLNATLAFNVGTRTQLGFVTHLSTTFFPKGFHKVEITPFVRNKREVGKGYYNVGIPLSYNSIAGFCLGAKFEVGGKSFFCGAEVSSFGTRTFSAYGTLFLGFRIR